MKRIIRYLLLIFVLVSFLASNFSTYGYYYDYDYDYDSPYIYDAYWDYKVARWSVDGRADKYEIILYRDGYRVTSQITYKKSLDCHSYMSKRGYEYYFEVRPFNYRTGWGTFVSSNSTYIDDYDRRDYDYRYSDVDNRYYNNSGDILYAKNQGPPMNGDSNNISKVDNSTSVITQNIGSTTVTVPTPQTVYDITLGLIPTGTFIKINGTWKYLYTNGIYATNVWILSNGKWYYIDINGNMVTGLYTINGKTFYLNQDGSMAVGSINLNGSNHFFDSNGIMLY